MTIFGYIGVERWMRSHGANRVAEGSSGRCGWMERLRFGTAWIVLARSSIFGRISLLVRFNHIDSHVTELLYLVVVVVCCSRQIRRDLTRTIDHLRCHRLAATLLAGGETCFLSNRAARGTAEKRGKPRVSTHANRSPSDVLTFGEI